jgi:3-dehydroquinate synthase
VPNPAVIRLDLAGDSYDILVQRGLLADVPGLVRTLTGANRFGVVADSALANTWLRRLLEAAESAGIAVDSVLFPRGENNKTISELESLYTFFLERRIDRKYPIVALGGGVVGDVAGFVAATLLRGVPFLQVPTTLLAMVDASVGGKTGVNHPLGKNLIGAFHQPRGVLIDPDVLSTLPHRELIGGLAECIKHDIIRDADGFARLESTIKDLVAGDLDQLWQLVAHNVAIKAAVVAADPFERGERAHLNFGHTFGHAIETVSEYSYSHGESVALGMAAATRLARQLKMIDTAVEARIVALIAAAGLPVRGLKLPVDQVAAAMAYDKKARAGLVRFVLPTRIGQVIVRDDVPLELAKHAIESLTAPA